MPPNAECLVDLPGRAQVPQAVGGHHAVVQLLVGARVPQRALVGIAGVVGVAQRHAEGTQVPVDAGAVAPALDDLVVQEAADVADVVVTGAELPLVLKDIGAAKAGA